MTCGRFHCCLDMETWCYDVVCGHTRRYVVLQLIYSRVGCDIY